MTIAWLLSASAAIANGQTGVRDASPGGHLETRCGWFHNPTPANVWFYDRDGEWTIGVQGGFQVDWEWPAFKQGQWVKTNGNYGYGCACLRLRVDPKTKDVLEIEGARARPLAACRQDRSLRKWRFK